MDMTKKKSAVTSAKPSAATKTAAKTAVQEPVSPVAMQLKRWNEAVRLFTQRNFDEACALFREVAAGPDSQVADKARSYLQICERKISRPDLQLRTSEDHFNYGVERMNARDLERARFHLERALGLEPDGDHILYTLSLCSGLAGDGSGACENLKRAIALEPRNRIMARQDAEFAALAGQYPALRAMLLSDSN
jgi:tetratricopeptide (TPR) repeat protein